MKAVAASLVIEVAVIISAVPLLTMKLQYSHMGEHHKRYVIN
jgi:hypothetical protein